MVRVETLPALARFYEANGVQPDVALDLSLVSTTHPIALFTSPGNMTAAEDYRAVIGKEAGDFRILPVDDPINEASRVDSPDMIPLVIHSATDPDLLRKMFEDGPKFGQLLMGHLYRPEPNHQSPSVHIVSVANQGLAILGKSPLPADQSKAEEMARRRGEILGKGIMSHGGFRDILRSPRVKRVIAHALGPTGTNIAQAMEQYIQELGIQKKTDLIVHQGGIEPLTYAELAAEEVTDGVVPIHMECAVFYGMAKLFDLRRNEVVLADHHYMKLDTMQLASIDPIEQLVNRGVMKITTHPSPMPLIQPWLDTGKANWIKASSNAEAAQMVVRGEADVCITTAAGLDRAPGLVSHHVFGRPWMLFTIATPLNQQQLKAYE